VINLLFCLIGKLNEVGWQIPKSDVSVNQYMQFINVGAIYHWPVASTFCAPFKPVLSSSCLYSIDSCVSSWTVVVDYLRVCTFSGIARTGFPNFPNWWPLPTQNVVWRSCLHSLYMLRPVMKVWAQMHANVYGKRMQFNLWHSLGMANKLRPDWRVIYYNGFILHMPKRYIFNSR